MRRSQRGASGLLILVILVLVAVGVLALNVASRLGSANDDKNNTLASLNKAAAALDAFAGATMRLPCPARPDDPAGDVGTEVIQGLADCKYRQGTIPWQTIGLSRSDAYDAWGHKISYRVDLGDGGNGSLVQPGGASMADCDINEAFPSGTTPVSGGVGGLCQPGTTGVGPLDPDPSHRTTQPAQFIAGKGLSLTDFTTPYDAAHSNGLAYVLISHGMTGLGSYTSSGVQLPMPKGDEKDNTQDTGPFHIEAFSSSDTGASDPSHFDDLLVYRTITDMAKRANLAARNWPDTILSSVTFDKNTLTAALGSSPGSDTGQTSIAFNNATVSAFNTSGAQDISFVHGGGNSDAIGGVSGSDSGLSSSGGEGLRIDFAEDARQFALTVDQFADAGALHEKLQLTFFEVNGTTVTSKATMIESSCAANGKVTSYSVDACAPFNRVEIRPLAMTDNTTPSSFTVAAIETCIDGVTCATSLQSSGNLCSAKTFTPCSIGTNDTSVLTVTLSNPNNVDMTGVAFTDTYPAGIVNATVPGLASACGGTLDIPTSNSLTLTGATVPANSVCAVTVTVTGSTAGAYNNITSDITTASAGTLAAVSQTLGVMAHPVVSMAFNPATVSGSTPSILTITLKNTNTTDIIGAAFVNIYPTGLSNSAIPSVSTTCGGVVVADSNPQVSLTGGTIPAAGSCTVTVSVTASPGTYIDTIAAGAVTTGNAGANSGAASDSLVVN